MSADWIKPSRSLLTETGRAIGDYKMIKNGDRVLLGLSGGKDSLSLLHTLHHLQQKAPVKFALACCTVDPRSPDYDPTPMKAYLAELGVTIFWNRNRCSKKPKPKWTVIHSARIARG